MRRGPVVDDRPERVAEHALALGALELGQRDAPLEGDALVAADGEGRIGLGLAAVRDPGIRLAVGARDRPGQGAGTHARPRVAGDQGLRPLDERAAMLEHVLSPPPWPPGRAVRLRVRAQAPDLGGLDRLLARVRAPRLVGGLAAERAGHGDDERHRRRQAEQGRRGGAPADAPRRAAGHEIGAAGGAGPARALLLVAAGRADPAPRRERGSDLAAGDAAGARPRVVVARGWRGRRHVSR